MAKYTLTLRAQQDLREIWLDIAEDNERAADRLLNRLLDKFELVAEHPEMGTARPALSPIARILIEGSYVVMYEPTSDGVEIMGVVYGTRDPSSWLD